MATKSSNTTSEPVTVAKETPAPKPPVEKKAAPVSKATPIAKPAPRKTTAGKITEGDVFYCETCGLTVVVDESGEIALTPNFVCCEEVMTYQPAKPKLAKKKAKADKKKKKAGKKKGK